MMQLLVNTALARVGGLVLALAIAASGQAQTILYVDDDAPPGGNGQGWATAYRFLQDALTAASQPGAAVDEIHVGQGLYKPDRDEANPTGTGDREATFQLIENLALMGGYAGIGAPDPDERNIALYETILSGDLAGDDEPNFVNYEENSYHVVLQFDGCLDGFTVTAGNADQASGFNSEGGGIVIGPDATVTDCSVGMNAAVWGGALQVADGASIADCTFTGNVAQECGGAVYAECGAGTGEPAFSGCTFSGNAAPLGGAVYCRDSLSFAYCTFDSNTAGESGGAIYARQGGCTLQNCIFSENSSELDGGCIFDFSSDVSAAECMFNGNTAASRGGGIYAYFWSYDVFEDCIFDGNTAQRGGGIYTSSDLGLVNVTCRNNTAVLGAGIFIDHADLILSGLLIEDNEAMLGAGVYTDGAFCEFLDCTITGNVAALDGGGAYVFAGAPTLTACTVEANSAADRGGGMFMVSAATTLLNCTFDANAACDGGAVFVAAGEPTFSECAFHGNAAEMNAGAVAVSELAAATAVQCTFGDNAAIIGGAVSVRHGASFSIAQCSLGANIASWGGGAIACYDASLIGSACTFAGNISSALGGAIREQSSFVDLTDCAFLGNLARAPDHARGGAISSSGGTLNLLRCDFNDNAVEHGTAEGGAIRTYESDLALTECEFIRNATSGIGGAIALDHGSFLAHRCLFRENISSGGSGGGMFSHQVQPSLLANCRFELNSAAWWGGAVFGWSPFSSYVNCVFNGNEAGGGGAIDTSESPSFINCTLTGNRALTGQGGGLLLGNYASPHLVNCVLWDNEPNDVYGGEAISATLTYCDIEDGWPGAGNISIDPLFADRFGPDGIAGTGDEDLRIVSGSPCIDAADNTAVPPDVLTDLLGNPRFVDDPLTPDTGFGDPPIVDMGAYEYQADGCPADVNGDGIVDVLDMLAVLAVWGQSGVVEDINGDGIVDVLDLLAVLGAWGPCP